MSLMKSFTEHPAAVGETYGQHFSSAMGFSLSMLRAAFCCALHALFPWCYEKTGSDCITGLYDRMIANRDRANGNGQLSASEKLFDETQDVVDSDTVAIPIDQA